MAGLDKYFVLLKIIRLKITIFFDVHNLKYQD